MISTFLNVITSNNFNVNHFATSIASFANIYNKKQDYFYMKTVYQGNSSLPTIIFINGFLQKDESVNDWYKAVSQKFPYNTKIWINWDSKKIEELCYLIFNIGEAMPRLLIDFWYTAYPYRVDSC